MGLHCDCKTSRRLVAALLPTSPPPPPAHLPGAVTFGCGCGGAVAAAVDIPATYQPPRLRPSILCRAGLGWAGLGWAGWAGYIVINCKLHPDNTGTVDTGEAGTGEREWWSFTRGVLVLCRNIHSLQHASAIKDTRTRYEIQHSNKLIISPP